MHAFAYETAGPAPDVLHAVEIETPEPAPGEVRVRITRSTVNPTDVKRRLLGRELGQFPSIVPNNDGAGIIEAVGSGVDGGRLNERVWLFGAQHGRPFGTAAEAITLPARQAITLPDTVSLADGACLGVPAVTAYHALFADGDIRGQTILISGAAGRVGGYAVQLARWAGATVIAGCRSEAKCRQALELGADHAVIYGHESRTQNVTDISGPVDRIVEVAFGANIHHVAEVLKPNGVIASYASDGAPEPRLPFLKLMYKNITIRPFSIYGLPEDTQDRAFAGITQALAERPFTHRVAEIFAFEDMIAAHQRVEDGAPNGAVQVAVGEAGAG